MNACWTGSLILLISADSPIPHGTEQGNDLVAQIALDGNLTVFCRSPDAAFHLQGLPQGSQILLGAHETGYQGNLLSTPVPPVNADTQALLLRGERLLLLFLLTGCICKVGIGRVNDAQTFLPIVFCHKIWFFFAKIAISFVSL